MQPKLKDLAHPFSLHDMNVAVDRLVAAFRAKEKILLYGDYDLDGTPGLALLYDGLTRLGFAAISVYQPKRLGDGYGMHSRLMPEFKAKEVSLIVTVDVGITDVVAVAAAREQGIDVIVTDHHLPKEILPAAVAIVNPNKGYCTSQLQHLCGTGVAFYLVLALKMEMLKLGLLAQDFNPKVLLDLFALATVTDMVPLVRENRVLVKHGLLQLSQSERPGVRRLFSELGFHGKKISSQDIAFRIAPKLNALTRLDEGVTALEVLMADDDDRAAKLVQETLLVNQRRREYQDKAKLVAAELVNQHAKDAFVWIYSQEFHPGVISLVASDLMDQLNVPVFVGASHGEDRIVGSARAPNDRYNLQDSLQAAAPVLNRFGGHKLAAGFEVDLKNTESLREHLNGFFTEFTKNQRSGGVEAGAIQAGDKVTHAQSSAPTGPEEFLNDAEIEIDELDASFMSWYDSLGPFGMGFEAPRFLLKGVRVTGLRKLKGTFLKYTLERGGRKLEAPWFAKARTFAEGATVDIIFEPQWNEFAGRRTIQAIIRDMRVSRSG